MRLNTSMNSIYVFKTGFVIPKLYSILTLIKDCNHQIFIFCQYSALNNDINFLHICIKTKYVPQCRQIAAFTIMHYSFNRQMNICEPKSASIFFSVLFFVGRKKFDSLFMFFLSIFQLKYKQFIYTESVTVRSPTTSYEKIFQSFAG